MGNCIFDYSSDLKCKFLLVFAAAFISQRLQKAAAPVDMRPRATMEQSLFRHLAVEDPIPQEAGAEPPVLRREEMRHTLRVLLVLLLPGASVRLHA